jgi:type I restriction enzyme S subunit
VKPLGEIGEALIGLTYKPTDVCQHGTLVLRSSNIQNDALAFDDNVFVDAAIPERIRVLNDDVLICVRNGSRDLIGKSALLDNRTKGMTFGAFMAVYRSQIGRLASYLFQSAILKRQINEHLGATINQITNKSINSFRIPVPMPSEQRAIATALSDVDGLLGGLDRLIAKKRDLKQAAMQQLLTGQTRLPGFHGEWEVKRLGDVANLYQPQTISANEFTESGFPVYGANGVVGHYHKANHNTWQVTVTCRGSTCGTVNRTVENCWITGNAMVLNCDHNRELDKDFFYHLLSIQNLSDCITGTGQPQIVRSPLAAFRVALPKTLPEQTAIAEVLTEMDGELAVLEQRRDKTRALKQAMMQELLTGKTRLV